MNATAVIEKKELNGSERGQASCDDCALSGTKFWTDESVARPKSSRVALFPTLQCLGVPRWPSLGLFTIALFMSIAALEVLNHYSAINHGLLGEPGTPCSVDTWPNFLYISPT